jgi:hypothetical protein
MAASLIGGNTEPGKIILELAGFSRKLNHTSWKGASTVEDDKEYLFFLNKI